jgi:hypothetical protein
MPWRRGGCHGGGRMAWRRGGCHGGGADAMAEGGCHGGGADAMAEGGCVSCARQGWRRGGREASGAVAAVPTRKGAADGAMGAWRGWLGACALHRCAWTGGREANSGMCGREANSGMCGREANSGISAVTAMAWAGVRRRAGLPLAAEPGAPFLHRASTDAVPRRRPLRARYGAACRLRPRDRGPCPRRTSPARTRGKSIPSVCVPCRACLATCCW